MSFAQYEVERRTSNNKFFTQINQIIDWAPVEKELKKVYKSGTKERGQKAYNPLILFKMQLISMWYNLSDVQTEEMTNENLSFMKFCGLALEDSVPDHSTLSRFRSELTQKKAYDRLLKKINTQLDPKLLRHVFANLLSNASKYAPENTTIDLKITTQKKIVRIEITDQGMGIPKEEQKDLFQRFFRAKNATNIEGTGLGLNIVKQYVELMKGNVGFKSELQKGSTFYFELPIK